MVLIHMVHLIWVVWDIKPPASPIPKGGNEKYEVIPIAIGTNTKSELQNPNSSKDKSRLCEEAGFFCSLIISDLFMQMSELLK